MSSFDSPRQNRSLNERSAMESGNPLRGKSAPFTVPRTGASAKLSDSERSALAATRRRLEFDSDNDSDVRQRAGASTRQTAAVKQVAGDARRKETEQRSAAPVSEARALPPDEDELTVNTLLARLKQVRAYISEAESMLRDTRTVEAAQVGGGSRELRERRMQIDRLLTSLREQETNYVWLLEELDSRAQQAVRRSVLQRVNETARRQREDDKANTRQQNGGDGSSNADQYENDEEQRDGSAERNASESDSSSTEIDVCECDCQSVPESTCTSERSLNAYTRPKIESRLGVVDSPHTRGSEPSSSSSAKQADRPSGNDPASKLRELREHLASLEQRKAQVDELLEKFGGLSQEGEAFSGIADLLKRREEEVNAAAADAKRGQSSKPAEVAAPRVEEGEEGAQQELVAMARQLGTMRSEADEVRSKLRQLSEVRERLAQMQSLLSKYDEQAGAASDAEDRQEVLVARPSGPAKLPVNASPGGSSVTVTTVDGDGDVQRQRGRQPRTDDEEFEQVDLARLNANVEAAMAHLAATRRERALADARAANEAAKKVPARRQEEEEDEEDEEDEEEDEEDEEDESEEEEEDAGERATEQVARVRQLETKLAELGAAKLRLEQLQQLADRIQQLRATPSANALQGDGDLVDQLSGEPEMVQLANELLERGKREQEQEDRSAASSKRYAVPQRATTSGNGDQNGDVRDEADSLRKLIEERERLLSMQRRLAELSATFNKAEESTRDVEAAGSQRTAGNAGGSVKFQEPSTSENAIGGAERTLIMENDVVYDRIRAGKQNAILKSALKHSAGGSSSAPAANSGGVEERADSDAAPTSTIDMTTLATWGGSSDISSTAEEPSEPQPIVNAGSQARASDANSPRSAILNNLNTQLANTTALCATLARGQERLHSMLSSMMPDRASTSSEVQSAGGALATSGALQLQSSSLANAQLSLSVTQCQQTLLYQHTEIQQLKQAVGLLLGRHGISYGPGFQQTTQRGFPNSADSDISLLSAVPRVQTPGSTDATLRSPSVTHSATGGAARLTSEAPRVREPELSPQEQAAFDMLRERIYNEVGALISQNETTPQYLLQLFRELQLLSNDDQRLSVLRAIRENAITNGSGARADAADLTSKTATRTARRGLDSASEDGSEAAAAPSWHRTASAKPNAAKEGTASGKARYASKPPMKPADAARLKTNARSTYEIDSASDSDALARVPRRAEFADDSDSQSELSESDGDPIMRFIRVIGRQLAETLGRLTSTTVDAVAAQLKTFVINKLEASAFCSLVPSTEAAGSLRQRDVETTALTRFFVTQLETALSNAIGKYGSKRVRDCCEDMLVDVADVLYTELNFFKLMQNLESADAPPLFERTAPRT